MAKEKMTVTEALSKINLTQKKIKDKRTAFMQYIVRPEMMKDPLEGEGGSEKFVAEQRQAVRDLEEYTVSLRLAIANSNSATSLTVSKTTKSVAEWLVWKRDIATGIRQELQSIVSAIIGEGRNRPKTREGEPVSMTVSLSEIGLHKEIEDYDGVWQELDGQLSLKNATTFVEV